MESGPVRIEYLARCHCGVLSARFRSASAPSTWSVWACPCAFCRVHMALGIMDPDGELEFAAAIPGEVQRYRFETRSADYLLCRRCGVYVGARMDSPHPRLGRGVGILNGRALRPVLENLSTPNILGEAATGVADRRAWRSALWTPLAAGSL